MGVKNIKLEKVTNNDGILYFIDYFKYKESDELIETIFKDFMENKESLLVIDTDTLYDRKASVSEQKIITLKQELEQLNIAYKEIVTKKEGNDKIFGIRMLKPTKVNSYKIGVVVSPEQLHKLLELYKNLNVFCYVPDKDSGSDELLDQFVGLSGDQEELNKKIGISLYIDSYFRRSRISCSENQLSLVEKKLQKFNS